MNGSSQTFEFLGLTFNAGNVISITIACVAVLALVYALSRHLTIKPGKKQNILEYAVDFTNGIVSSSVSGETSRMLGLWGFSLFLFLLVANNMGLFLHIDVSGISYVKSPTSDPVVTMTFSLMTLMLAQFLGIRTLGYKKHFQNYLKPFVFFLPVNLFEEFTNFLTLGLRLFGNILSGEMLLGMITSMATGGGPVMWIGMLPLELLWQGFSVFISCIQAYVFVTLSSVYISQKIEVEE